MGNRNPPADTETEVGISPSPSSTTPQQPPSPPTLDLTNWKQAQDTLKRKLVTEDDFAWKLLGHSEDEEAMALKFVGGVDISFSKVEALTSSTMACGTLVVLELPSLQVVYEDFALVDLRVPYVPGYLAFREAPVLLELLERMKNSANPFYPQVLMVDGNGVLHPRGFGLACHLGVLANLPTIGVGKNLHHVDGLTVCGVKELLKAREHNTKDFIPLIGNSGHMWGVAMRSTRGGSGKPIFISIGHRISLETAIAVVKLTCKFRVPEPTRQADIRSREYLRKQQL